jgi:hypothetical protein
MHADQVPSPADVLAVVVVYVPHLRGYFTNRLAVVRLSLESLCRQKPAETKLLVFDNGSCTEVRGLLAGMLQDGRIDFMVRSRSNIGTPAAIGIIFRLGLRPVIAYGDDDVFYGPGWLEPQLDVLARFPMAGMVSGVATLDGADHAVDGTLQALRSDRRVTLDLEGRIPEAWEQDWALSTGRDPTQRGAEARATSVPRLEADGIRLFVGATHFQYVGWAERLAACLPREWPTSLMGNMRDLDEAMNRQGYLRLSTAERHVRHMGNAVAESVRRDAASLGLHVAPAVAPPRLTELERRLERVRRIHSKIWVTYRSIGQLLDGEAILSDALVRAEGLVGQRATIGGTDRA